MSQAIDIQYTARVFFRLFKYLPKTLEIALLAMVFAFLLGAVFAVIQINKIPILSQIVNVIVLLIRACPVMIQIFIVFYGVPLFTLYLKQLGVVAEVTTFDPDILGIIALSVYSGAFVSQVLRGAMQSVDKGQMEAALSIGMGWGRGFLRIVFPQAVIYAIPPLISQFLNLLKGTSILFTISVLDLMAGAKLEAATSYRYLECYIASAVIYWIISAVIEKLMNVYSKKNAVFLKA